MAMPDASVRPGDAPDARNRRVPAGCGEFGRPVRQVGSAMTPASLSPSFLPERLNSTRVARICARIAHDAARGVFSTAC